MWIKGVLIFLFCFSCAVQSIAQGELTQSRILILLDGSSSMTEPWSGDKKKFKAANELIMRLMDSVYAVNKDVEFSLRVFGHQHTIEENYCLDTKNEVPFAKQNRIRMSLRLDAIHPLGVTPIAFALKEAAEHDLLDEAHNAYSIILITDGGESCGGDICDVMRKLINSKITFKPYIVSLEADPALKITYSCMGEFLQVIKPDDLPLAVTTLVDAFRPVLKITPTEYKELKATVIKTPSILKVNPRIIPEPKKDTVLRRIVPEPKKDTPLPKPIKTFKKDTLKHEDTIVFTRPDPTKIILPLPEKIIRLSLAKAKPFAIYSDYSSRTLNLKPVDPGVIPAPVFPDTIVVEPPRTKDKILRVTVGKPQPVAVAAPIPVLPGAREFNLPVPEIIIEQPVEPRKVKIASLKPAPARMFNVFFVIEDRPFPTRKVPPIPESDVAKADKALYTTTVEDAKETTLEVLFTNGKGRYYSSTPQVYLFDPATNKVVKKFYRTVDASGNPDPQTNIPAGNFDFAFSAKKGFVVHGVHIENGKNNKLVVKVKNTSLSFAYLDAPGRPVTEFTAVVTERNKSQGRIQSQKCTEPIEYEPGNYHIEINTFPKDVRNVDLDFDAETVITIPQPGFAKFIPNGNASSISLYQRLGDKFLNFYSIDINDPRTKHLNMQPGEYQVHYQKGPKYGAEQVQQFIIKANQETEVILK